MHLSKNSCGVIRFKSEDALQILVIPTSEDIDYPFTAQGFTSGNNGKLSVPEWYLQSRIDIQEGTEIWKITRDDKQTLYAVFKEGKFIVIK